MIDDSRRGAFGPGEPVVLPFDTVYGLAADPEDEDAVERLYRLKGRAEGQPTALVAATLDQLLERIPELQGPARPMMPALLPGPFTLIVPNPARRFSWLTGPNPDAIGVRVPGLSGPGGDGAPSSRRRRGNEREPSGRARSAARSKRFRRRSASGAGAALDGGRAPGHAVDGGRPHRHGAARPARGRSSGCRGALRPTGVGSTIQLTTGRGEQWPSRSRPSSS